MKSPIRLAVACFAAAGLLAGGAPGAAAQSWPQKPIRMVVPIAAGSVTDVILRAAANELQPRLGQPIIIENKGGAAGILGATACAQSAPDGHTFCAVYHNTMSYNPLLFTKLPYSPDDIVPVGRLFFLVEGVFVSTDLGVSTVAELKAKAQARPDALNYATLGEGSLPDLFLRWTNNQWNTKIQGIPYKGGGPAAQALMAGEAQMTRFGVGNFRAALQSGKVKALAVSSPERSPLLPEVPTAAEAGLGGYPGIGWWGLGAPKGTPPEVIARLAAEFARLFSEPKFKAFLDQQAVMSAPTGPEAFVAFLAEDRKAAEQLIRIADTRPEEYKGQ
ncbi:tripartite tricarboxylate transporter substrate binding protein [Rhodoplanes sp. TEM]|uniref:Tripartite tricarboxylate transporter substrate binding protein n=1 Tax=Rhodoplanes tepidamans TaxID=200616 RepID=A0ABT5J497_RHOTP|nr:MULTISPECIES: tripartite tricarboxylate transporter substrate binding protein [Rhodoplanes]MDC7784464.1 tripartite tricarboxylate transporter substrate binding protein [Rhodoplanes tepidamans]MDC7983494.1 tripartite tricarboxylate transporter substrate binding protein [Rhodoplanes sp. TEM]MDQ0356971.1 tripartite-type tricarboxylate transporter receptor subunit TctC [Rhodoplanes tepidamans]